MHAVEGYARKTRSPARGFSPQRLCLPRTTTLLDRGTTRASLSKTARAVLWSDEDAAPAPRVKPRKPSRLTVVSASFVRSPADADPPPKGIGNRPPVAAAFDLAVRETRNKKASINWVRI